MKKLSLDLAPVVAALPTASVSNAGAIVRLSTDNKPYYSNGGSWVDLTLSGGGSSLPITISAAAPATPAVGDIWIDIS